MYRWIIGLSISLLFLAVAHVGAEQITDDKYEVYYGDLNSDGVSDIYIHGKAIFVLLHGDVITPILVDGPTGLVIYRSDDSYAGPTNYSISHSDLNQRISSGQLQKAQVDLDYYLWSNGANEPSQLLIRGHNSTAPSVLVSTYGASEANKLVSKVFPADGLSTANLSDRAYSISLQDRNGDGNLDIVINNFAYLSGGQHIVSSVATSLNQSGSVTKTYTYDDLGRLTHSITTDGTEKDFHYDSEDNRESVSTIKGVN